MALANGAVSFVLCSGRHPLIRSKKGVQDYETEAWTFEDMETFLRELMGSRQMRQFRVTGLAYFRSTFGGCVLLCAARIEGEEIRLEMRRLGA